MVNLRFAIWSTTTFEWNFEAKMRKGVGTSLQLKLFVFFLFFVYTNSLKWFLFRKKKHVRCVGRPVGHWPKWLEKLMLSYGSGCWSSVVSGSMERWFARLQLQAARWEQAQMQTGLLKTCMPYCKFDVYSCISFIYWNVWDVKRIALPWLVVEEDFVRVAEDIKDVTPTVREDMLKQHADLVRLILASNRACTWFQVIIRLKILCCGSGPSMYLNQQAVYGQWMILKQHLSPCSRRMASRQRSWCEALMILSTASFEISCFDMTSSGNIAGRRHGSHSQPSLCSERYGFLMSNFSYHVAFYAMFRYTLICLPVWWGLGPRFG